LFTSISRGLRRSAIVVASCAATLLCTASALAQSPTVTLAASCTAPCTPGIASITLTATPATTAAGRAIAKVEFYREGTLIGVKNTSAPWTFTDATRNAGSYSYWAKAFDNATTPATGSSTVQKVSVGTNVAASANGGSASASTTKANYPVAGTINGDRKGTSWGTVGTTSGGWEDNNSATYPDWLQVNFTAARYISEIDVFTAQTNTASPVEPAYNTTFTANGIQAFVVQTWNGTAWVTVTGGSVTANNLVWTRFRFAPITTDRIRVQVTAALNNFSRITELEAWGTTANAAPTISLTAACSATPCNAPATVNLTATPADADGTIGKVEFYDGATLLATSTVSPWTLAVNSVAAGAHSYTAKAYDNAGAPAVTTSAAQAITVLTPAPTVSLTAACSASPCNAPASITLSATAATVASGRTISKVEFYDGATFVGSDATSPYSLALTNVAGGAHSYTAKAIDSGTTPLATTSSAQALTVITPNTAPTITLVAACSTTPCINPATVNLTATPADAGGAVLKVEFYRDGLLLASPTVAPWTFSNGSLAAGSYNFTAKVFDNGSPQLTTTSAVQAVTVAIAPPTVSLTATCSATPCNAPASVTLAATAATVGTGRTLSKVEFYDGATLLGSDATSPYSLALTNVTAGAHNYTAKAIDSGATPLSTVSAQKTITALTPNLAPTVTLAAACAANPCVGPATINLTASPADTDGTITKVEFYRDGLLIGNATTSPWTFANTAVAAGSYAYTAIAYDNGTPSLASLASAQSAITVTAPLVAIGVGRPARQSSIAPGSDPKRANNGVVETALASAAVTQQETNPWWDVDLGGFYDIKKIRLTAPAAGCCGATARNFKLLISEHPFQLLSGDALATQQTFFGNTQNVSAQVTPFTWSSSAPTDLLPTLINATTTRIGTGRYVRIWAEGLTTLELAEVEIFGVSAFQNNSTNLLTIQGYYPKVHIASPTDGQALALGAPLTVTANADVTDATVGIARIDLYDGQTLIGTKTAAPFDWNLGSITEKDYNLITKTTLANTFQLVSSPNLIKGGQLATQSVRIVSPASGATVYTHGSALPYYVLLEGTYNATLNHSLTYMIESVACCQAGAWKPVKMLQGSAFRAYDLIPGADLITAPTSYRIKVRATATDGSVISETVQPFTLVVPSLSSTTPPPGMTGPTLPLTLNGPTNNIATIRATLTPAVVDEVGTQWTRVQVSPSAVRVFRTVELAPGATSANIPLSDGFQEVTAWLDLRVYGYGTQTITNALKPAAIARMPRGYAPRVSIKPQTASSLSGYQQIPSSVVSPLPFAAARGIQILATIDDPDDSRVALPNSVEMFVDGASIGKAQSCARTVLVGTGTGTSELWLDSQLPAIGTFGGPTVEERLNISGCLSQPLSALAAGAHQFSAKATDAEANVTTSANLAITVGTLSAAVTAPVNGATVALVRYVDQLGQQAYQTPVSWTASAAPPAGKQYKVETWLNGQLNTSELFTTATGTAYIRNAANGTYMLVMRVVTPDGSYAESPAISVTVLRNTAPTVSITAPTQSKTFYGNPATIPITVVASDADGTLANIVIKDGSTVIQTVNNPSGTVTFNWTNALPGTHALTAVATDNLGASTSSSTITATVQATSPTPTVTASLKGGATGYDLSMAKAGFACFRITVGVPSNDLQRIEFFLDGAATPFKTDTAPPLNGVTAQPHCLPVINTAGSYTVKVRVLTAANASAESLLSIALPDLGKLTFISPANKGYFAPQTLQTGVPVVLDASVPAGQNGTLIYAGVEAGGNFGRSHMEAFIANGGANRPNLAYTPGAPYAANWTSPEDQTITMLPCLFTTAGIQICDVDYANNSMTFVTEPRTVSVVLTPPATPVRKDVTSTFTINVSGTLTAAVQFVGIFDATTRAPIQQTPVTSPGQTNISMQQFVTLSKTTTLVAVVRTANGLEQASSPITITPDPTIPTNRVTPGWTDAGGLTPSFQSTTKSKYSFVGRLTDGGNVSVFVNNMPTAIDETGQFTLNGLPLTVGNNTLTIVVNRIGSTITYTTNVVRAPSPHDTFDVQLNRTSGFAPLSLALTVTPAANATFSRIAIDTEDDGTDDFNLPATGAASYKQALSYPTKGSFTLRISAYDASGQKIFETRRYILVTAAAGDIAVVQGVYLDMLDSLQVGNKALALLHFTEDAVPKFQSTFDRLGATLAQVVTRLGQIEVVKVSDGYAEILVSRDQAGQKRGYRIYLIRDWDGLWRLVEM
jgi:hypothetical protein